MCLQLKYNFLSLNFMCLKLKFKCRKLESFIVQHSSVQQYNKLVKLKCDQNQHVVSTERSKKDPRIWIS